MSATTIGFRLIFILLYFNDLPSIFSTKLYNDLLSDDTEVYSAYTSESEKSIFKYNLCSHLTIKYSSINGQHQATIYIYIYIFNYINQIYHSSSTGKE